MRQSRARCMPLTCRGTKLAIGTRTSAQDRGGPETTENKPLLGPVVFIPLLIILALALIALVMAVTGPA